MTDRPDDTNKPEHALDFCAVHDRANGAAMTGLTRMLPGWGFIVVSIDPTGHRHTATNVPPLDAADAMAELAHSYLAHAEREKATAEQAGKELNSVLERFANRAPDGETKH